MAKPGIHQSKEEFSNAIARIQYHLFRHPLYEGADSDTLHVFLFGLGQYGTEFLDAALQSGQIIDRRLCVTVFSDRIAEDKQQYADRERPALKDFFDIDRPLTEGSYGAVSFRQLQFTFDAAENEELILQALCEDESADKVNYVFAALGDDELNYSAAKAAKELTPDHCVVSFPVVDNAFCQLAEDEGMIPIEVTQPIEEDPIFPIINNMAFNCHTIWKKEPDFDYDKEKNGEEYLSLRKSCVQNVLAIKSKLHSMGIALTEEDLCDIDRLTGIAARFEEEKSNQELFDKLVWIEHRRWVTEYICNGYTRLDVKDCPVGATRDRAKKKHLCIVKSDPTGTLAQLPKSRWDDKNILQDTSLDELERMSVSLHQHYREQSKTRFTQALIHKKYFGDIHESIEAVKNKHPQLFKGTAAAFNDYKNCVYDIVNGEHEKVYIYPTLLDALCNSIDEVIESAPTDANLKLALCTIKEGLERFDKNFAVVRCAEEYRDFKKDDIGLVDNIPAILTLSDSVHLIVPFTYGDGDEEFGNIAAAAIINPKKVTFIRFVGEKSEYTAIRNTMNHICEFSHKKLLRTKFELLVIHLPNAAPGPSFLNSSEYRVTPKLLEDEFALPERLREVIGELTQEEAQSYLEKRKSSYVSGVIAGAGIYQEFRSYEFFLSSRSFATLSGEIPFRFIRKKRFLRVSDQASFINSAGTASHPDYLNEYQTLWRIYNGSVKPEKGQKAIHNKDGWKQLADKLQKCKGDAADPLKIKNLQLGSNSDTAQKTAEENVLREMKRHHYILGLQIEQDRASFTFASEKYKTLMEKGGNMLEFYVYHHTKLNGNFDDVVNSFQIEWQSSSRSNEFDIIATRGYSTLVIECKATEKMDKSYLFKLSSLTKLFGINAKAVIIADSVKVGKSKEWEEECELYHINFIHRKEDIDNIGKVLSKII